MKLALAQFRELEAFSQFASDLDADTKKQIDRGRRLTELLKQPQYSPMAVAEQVVSIYSAGKGYLDTVEIEKVKEFETGLLEFMRTTRAALMAKIQDGQWGDEVEAEIKSAIEEFKNK